MSTSNLLQCFGQENMLLEFLLDNFLFSGAKIVIRPMKSNYPMKINILGINFFDKISSFCEYIKFLGVIWTRRYAFGVFIRNFALFGGENHLRPKKLNFPMKIYTLGKNFFYKNILYL